MTKTDLSTLSATAQADALASGATSATELLSACLGRIAAQDGGTNEGAMGAFWCVDAQGAKAAAKRADARRSSRLGLGRFDGLTLAIKDNIDVKGLPTTAGLAAHRGRIAAEDAPLVARLRETGLVIVGKTALHEGALGATTDTPGFGRCHNPLRHGYTPGGSSGGSAAAVAAHFAALAIGTDTMGSVRIPAAYCGVTGLKATAGLISRSGVTPLSSTLDCIGVLALTPRDAAAALQLMAGHDRTDAGSRAAPAGWRALADGMLDLPNVIIGLPRQLDLVDVEPVIRHSYRQACDDLAAHGARLIEISIADWEPARLRRAALLTAEVEASQAHASLIDDPDAASAAFRSLLAYGRAASPARYEEARAELGRIKTSLTNVLEQVDAIFLPTAPQRAFLHGTAPPANQADLTVPANAAGLPAIAFPWPCADGDLPSSMQLIGREFDEATLVAIAEKLHQPLQQGR